MSGKFIKSLFSLQNKVAIVTGAAGYFGKAFTKALLMADAKVILFARGGKIKKLCKELKSAFGNNKVDYCSIDLYDDDNYENHLMEKIKENATVDILVNNAFEFGKETGFNDISGKIENIKKTQWMRSFESGVYWHAHAIQVVGERMKQQGDGSIINISSMYAIVSPDPDLYEGFEVFNPPSYGAAKAAILALTRYTASFYGQYNIRCNAIVPGAFPNMDPNSSNSPKNKDFIKRLENKTVLKRTGRLDDLTGALIFLSSDASSYITGQTIIIDGGWTIR